MNSIKNWMLGTAIVAGALGLGATTARAAEFGIYVGGPVAYLPPCPGPGYVWVAGYYANGYWVPGRWNFVHGRDRFAYFDHDRDRHFYRDWRYDRYRDRR